MNETPEETYTAKDFGKDVAKDTAMILAAQAIAMGALMGVAITAHGVQKLKERRAAKKALKN